MKKKKLTQEQIVRAEQAAKHWLTLATTKEPVCYTDAELSDTYRTWVARINSLDAVGRARLGPEFKDAFADRDSLRIHRSIANIALYILEHGIVEQSLDKDDLRTQINRKVGANNKAKNESKRLNAVTRIKQYEIEEEIQLDRHSKWRDIVKCARAISRSPETVLEKLQERDRKPRNQ